MSTQRSVAYRCLTVILSALLVIASLSITGCSLRSLIPSGDTTQTTKAPVTSAKPSGTAGTLSADQTNKPLMPSYYNPLTGLNSPTDLSAIRPVAVCYGNGENSPQFGIGQAEVLIEAPIEDGSTRLLGITNTYTACEQLGAIRASRPYLNSLASAFSAVSVHNGTSDIDTQNKALAFPSLDYRNEGLASVFYRSSAQLTPNDIFTSGTRLLGAMESFERIGAKMPFSFSDRQTTLRGGAAGGIAIPYSSTQISQFVFNKSSGLYLRSQNKDSHTDESGKQLGYANLLVLVCESSTTYTVDGVEFNLNVEKGGRGYCLTAGTYTEIFWSRDASGALVITDVAGAELKLNCGKTYIGLVPLPTAPSILIVE